MRLAVLLVGAGLLAGCTAFQQTTQPAPEQPPPEPEPEVAEPEPEPEPPGPPMVAMLLPLSGDAAQLGQDMLEAAQMALFDVGETDLVLLPKDTGGTAEGARAAAREALEDGAELILGPLFAASTEAVGPIAAEAGLDVVSFSNNAAVAGDNVYILGFRPEEQVERVVRFARQRGYRRIAALAPDDAYGQRAVSAWRQTLDEAEGRGRYRFYPSDETQAAAVVREFTEADRRLPSEPPGSAPIVPSDGAPFGVGVGRADLPFDAILVADGGSRLRSIAALLVYYDVDTSRTRLLGTMLWQEDPRLLVEPTLQGGWFATLPPEDESGFQRRFERYFDREPLALAGLAFDATALAADIARSADGFPTDLLTDPAGFVGRAGIFRIRPDGLSEHGLAVVEIQGGTLREIDPAPRSFATGFVR